MKEFDESAYLRGREVAFRLAPESGDGEPETIWLRLNMNAVAGIEEEFGGVRDFSTLFEDRPTRTLIRVLAIAMGARVPLEAAILDSIGARLLEEEHAEYLGGVEAMWLLAHGGTVEEAGKAWKGRATIVADRTSSAAALFDRVLKEAARIASRGANGSRPGRKAPTGR